MRAQVAAVVLFLSAGLALADDGPALPIPKYVPSTVKTSIAEPIPAPVSAHEWNTSLKKLKTEREALATESLDKSKSPADTQGSEDNAKLRRRIAELLDRMKAQQTQPKPAPLPEPAARPVTPPPTEEKIQAKPVVAPESVAATKPEVPVSNVPGRPIDPLVLAHALFRAKNFDGALRAYRLIDLHGMKAEERAPIQYLTAACLKRLGKTEEAAGVFREVANSKGDEYVALCAQWQLATMRWQRDIGETLKDVRRRQQALGAPP